jgi:hypothetical protein
MTEENRLTLRTVTTVIQILREALDSATGSTTLQLTEVAQPPEIRAVVRSLGALSTLLVRNHEVAAIVMDDSNKNTNPKLGVVKLFATVNPRRPSPPETNDSDAMTFQDDCKGPTIIHPPESNIDPDDPIPYLRETW